MIITSSWISDFIREFLYYKKISFNKISIKGNTLKINDKGRVTWYEDDIITSLNKWEYMPNLSEYEKIVLLWDNENDLKMYNWSNVIKI